MFKDLEVVSHWYRGLTLCGSVLVHCKYICLVLILKDVGFVGWCVISYRSETVIYVSAIDFFFTNKNWGYLLVKKNFSDNISDTPPPNMHKILRAWTQYMVYCKNFIGHKI